MSQKAARKARTVAKAPPPVKGSRGASSNRFWLYVSAAAVVIVAAVALIVVSLVGGDSKSATPATIDGTETQQLLNGIPQDGTVLGSPDAPVTLVEYADPQCPYCAQFATTVMPSLIDQYVKSGKLRVEYRGFPIIGPDSTTGLEAIYSAANQGKAWNVTNLLYLNQGSENDGWLNEQLIRNIGAAIPGVDVDALVADMKSQKVSDAIKKAAVDGQAAGANGTPFFQIGKTGGKLETLGLQKLDVETFTTAIDKQLES